MVEFFVPETENREKSEEVWEATVKFVEDQRGQVDKDRRIYSIKYKDGSESYEVAIGDIVPQTGEPAFVILESETHDMHLICTPTRAVAEGTPIMIGNHNVINTEYFDEDSY